jgi:hypothetical protein
MLFQACRRQLRFRIDSDSAIPAIRWPGLVKNWLRKVIDSTDSLPVYTDDIAAIDRSHLAFFFAPTRDFLDLAFSSP